MWLNPRMDDIEFEGTISFVDYGADDFSNFSEDERIVSNRGNWFWIGVRVDGKDTIFALDAENFGDILIEADCARMSQLLNRKMYVNLTKRYFHIVK